MVRQNSVEQSCDCNCHPIPPYPPSPSPIVSVRSVNGKVGDVVLDSLTCGDKVYNGSAAVEILPKDLDLEKAFVFRKSVATVAQAEAYMQLTDKVGDTCYCVEDKKFYMSTGEGQYLTWISTAMSEQVDWAETDPAKPAYIKNKPDLTVFALKNQAGNKIILSIEETTYKLTAALYDINNNLLSSSVVDLPLEHLVQSGRYDATSKSIILTLYSGQEIVIPVGDLVSDLATKAELTQAQVDVKSWVVDQGYLTQPSLADYYKKSEVDSKLVAKQNKLTAGNGIEITTDNIINCTVEGKLTQSITANVTVGGIDAGTTFAAGTTFEQIIKQLLTRSRTLLSIQITTHATKQTYRVGEVFDPTGMVVKANYDIGDPEVVTNYTYAPTGALTLADTQITVSYQGKSATEPITVSGDTVNIYYGATTQVPTGIAGLTVKAISAASIIGVQEQNIKAGSGEDPQYPIYAVPVGYKVTSWKASGFELGKVKITADNYNIYYLDEPAYDIPEGSDYQITIAGE